MKKKQFKNDEYFLSKICYVYHDLFVNIKNNDIMYIIINSYSIICYTYTVNILDNNNKNQKSSRHLYVVTK